ncbi:MAG: aspartate--tRNA ligase [Planctomycetota bacterium]
MRTLSARYRTVKCGELRLGEAGRAVQLAGWVQNWRDHGGLLFIDLRDRTGITQIVFDPNVDKAMFAEAGKLRCEYVITVTGTVRPRLEGNANLKHATGEIEVLVKQFELLSASANPPFEPNNFAKVGEDTRLKYRYIDLRRPQMQRAIEVRHKAAMAARNFLNTLGFLEVETPILTKSTPEGARDYLVPARLHPGKFYALPQSPQMFKQLLMVAGVDRYYQICRCFRDEDSRADRQPEFTQIDIEMSFIEKEDIFAVTEGLIAAIFKECLDVDLPVPFTRLQYRDAMARYGCDKPDTRYGMELVDITELMKASTFKVFQSAVEAGSIVKGLCVKGGAEITRKPIDNYTAFVADFGAKGLAWMKLQEGKLQSSIAKFFTEDQLKALAAAFGAAEGDLILMVADAPKVVHSSLDALRRRLARDRNLVPEGKLNFLWVDEFPLFQWNAGEQRYDSEHHPFTAMAPEDIPLLDTDPLKVRSQSYDLVLNGYELGSGSIRIHRSDLQEKVFRLLKLSEEDITTRFGFFVEALKYGTPPHGGIAPGLDRIVMLLLGTDNIRDVIAFPKTQKAACLMTNAPSTVDHKQLRDLSIESTAKEE